MGRKNRYAPLGFAHHVVNRGNDRQTIFREHFDYAAFMELLAESVRLYPVKGYGYCVMPNHFHLLIEPLETNALSAFMQRVTGRYACTFRQQTETVGNGHVVQRRFWNAPARDSQAFLDNLRYIEANPVRAGLVSEADLWPWSSFSERLRDSSPFLAPLPVELPTDWGSLVNTRQGNDVLKRIRKEMRPSPGRPKTGRQPVA